MEPEWHYILMNYKYKSLLTSQLNDIWNKKPPVIP